MLSPIFRSSLPSSVGSLTVSENEGGRPVHFIMCVASIGSYTEGGQGSPTERIHFIMCVASIGSYTEGGQGSPTERIHFIMCVASIRSYTEGGQGSPTERIHFAHVFFISPVREYFGLQHLDRH